VFAFVVQDVEEEELAPRTKPHAARRLMDPDTRSIDSDDYQDFESYQSQQLRVHGDKGQHPPVSAAAAAVAGDFYFCSENSF